MNFLWFVAGFNFASALCLMDHHPKIAAFNAMAYGGIMTMLIIGAP